MGTNYYIKTKKCKTCGHKPKRIHLGKSSGGWQFSFQYNGGKFYKNIDEMKKWLEDKKIIDDCGESISHEEFWKMVKSKQNPKYLNHAIECPDKNNYVIDGYSFTDLCFS